MMANRKKQTISPIMGSVYMIASVSRPEEREQLEHLSGYDWTGGGDG